jgi:simple sugar transport system permease protein
VEKLILKYFTLIRVIIALVIGVAVTILLIYLISEYPGESLKYFFAGPLASKSRLFNIFEMASPMIFCGVAIAVSFQADQFNLGAEGSFFRAAAVGTAFAVSTNMPAIIHIPLVLLVAGVTGAFWGLIPGILKAKWHASELVSSLMMNYVAYFLGLYIINAHFRDKTAGFLVSLKLPETARLAQFLPGTRLHWGILLAVLTALGAYYFLYHTTSGYEFRLTGYNKNFSRFGGVNIMKVIILSQLLLGFIAGIGGMSEIMGIHHRFQWQQSPGYGWDGIIVAIIGRSHPILIIFASLLLAYLRIGGQVLNLMGDVPAELVSVIQSLIILLITAEAFLGQWKYRITRRQAEKEEAAE